MEKRMEERLGLTSSSMGLLEYIGIAEAILLPGYEEFEYPCEVAFREASEEEKSEADLWHTLSLGLTECKEIFITRVRDKLGLKKD